MSKKDCPSCGAQVPVEAHRCKHCFHDFSETPKRKTGPVVFLGFVAAMMCAGAGLTWYNYQEQALDRILVDPETRSIVVARKTAETMDSERVGFDRIEKVEHVMGGEESMFEVVAVTLEGQRYVVQSSDERPLTIAAQQIAQVIGKPLVEVNKVKGFGN